MYPGVIVAVPMDAIDTDLPTVGHGPRGREQYRNNRHQECLAHSNLPNSRCVQSAASSPEATDTLSMANANPSPTLLRLIRPLSGVSVETRKQYDLLTGYKTRAKSRQPTIRAAHRTIERQANGGRQ